MCNKAIPVFFVDPLYEPGPEMLLEEAKFRNKSGAAPQYLVGGGDHVQISHGYINRCLPEQPIISRGAAGQRQATVICRT